MGTAREHDAASKSFQNAVRQKHFWNDVVESFQGPTLILTHTRTHTHVAPQ